MEKVNCTTSKVAQPLYTTRLQRKTSGSYMCTRVQRELGEGEGEGIWTARKRARDSSKLKANGPMSKQAITWNSGIVQSSKKKRNRSSALPWLAYLREIRCMLNEKKNLYDSPEKESQFSTKCTSFSSQLTTIPHMYVCICVWYGMALFYSSFTTATFFHCVFVHPLFLMIVDDN